MKNVRDASVAKPHRGKVAISVALIGFGAGSLLVADDAKAVCAPAVGDTVACTGAANPLSPNYSNAADNLIVNVGTSATLGVLLGAGGTALTLTGSNVMLNNSGTIDTDTLGTLAIVSGGVVMGNTSANVLTVNNYSGAVINGSTGEVGVEAAGLALDVENAAGGTTMINNAGTIGSNLIAGASVADADKVSVAVYGGGQVDFTNTGTITGRVGFASSVGGNYFANAGSIVGSVSLGAGSTNTFEADTGSSISAGTGASAGALSGVFGSSTVSFAAAGMVDGGAGGNNTLSLSQATGGPTAGQIDMDNYINFQNLDVAAGTWTITGTSSATATTLESGATAIIDNFTELGDGTITAKGGALQVSGVTVELDNDVTLGTGGLIVQSGGDLRLSGKVDGTGALTVNGALVTLTGVNTYSGGTVLNGGGLVLANASAMGTGSLTVDGQASLFTSTANLVLANDVSLTTGGRLLLQSNSAVTLAGDISGAGELFKEGAATVTLTGDESYGGGTVIDIGTLALGAGASMTTTGTVQLTSTGTAFDMSAATADQTIGGLSGVTGSQVNLGAHTLSVAGTGSETFAGVLSGSGGFAVASGQQTLSAVNTYTGATSISEGATLLLNGDGSIASSSGVTDAGTFDISGTTSGATIATLSGAGSVALGTKTLTLANQSGAFDGHFTGSGRLLLQGSGSLVLTGDSSAFDGSTEVAAGLLEVGNASSPSAVLGGDVQVDAGATLAGHGTVLGDVDNNGIVSPGGTIGTLTVGGNYTQASTATLSIEVSPTAASQLNVAGSAALDGALSIQYDPGTYTAKSYTLVSAASVTGKFASVTSTNAAALAPMTPSISYLSDAVDLTLTGAPTSVGTAPVVIAPVDTSIYTAVGTSALFGAQAQGEAVLKRLGSASASGSNSASTWATATGTWTNVGGTSGAPGFETDRYGFLAGRDQTLGDNTIGVAAGYDHTTINEQDTGDSGKIDTLRASLYGSHAAGPVKLGATVGVGLDFLSQERPFDAMGTARGNHVGQEFNLGTQASLPMSIGGVTVTPLVGLRYAYFHANSFGESGAGGQDLNVGTDSVRSLQPYAQLAFDHAFGSELKPVNVEFRVGYAHELLDTNRALNVSSQDDTAFTASGANLPRCQLTTGLSVGTEVRKNLRISLSYDALLDTSHVSAQQGSLHVGYAF